MQTFLYSLLFGRFVAPLFELEPDWVVSINGTACFIFEELPLRRRALEHLAGQGYYKTNETNPRTEDHRPRDGR